MKQRVTIVGAMSMSVVLTPQEADAVQRLQVNDDAVWMALEAAVVAQATTYGVPVDVMAVVFPQALRIAERAQGVFVNIRIETVARDDASPEVRTIMQRWRLIGDHFFLVSAGDDPA